MNLAQERALNKALLKACLLCYLAPIWPSHQRRPNSEQYLVPSVQIAIGTWDNSLPICAWWSDLLFVPGSSCVALLLQLCQLSSSPSNVGPSCFEYHPQSPEISSGIHHGSVLGGWLVAPPHPHSQPLLFCPGCLLKVFSPCPTPILQGRFVFHPTPAVSVRLQFAVYTFQFSSEGLQSAQGLHWIRFPGWVGELRVAHVAHPLGLQVNVGSFETGQWGEMRTTFLEAALTGTG
jgi:hypothetical protein